MTKPQLHKKRFQQREQLSFRVPNDWGKDRLLNFEMLKFVVSLFDNKRLIFLKFVSENRNNYLLHRQHSKLSIVNKQTKHRLT